VLLINQFNCFKTVYLMETWVING